MLRPVRLILTSIFGSLLCSAPPCLAAENSPYLRKIGNNAVVICRAGEPVRVSRLFTIRGRKLVAVNGSVNSNLLRRAKRRCSNPQATGGHGSPENALCRRADLNGDATVNTKDLRRFSNSRLSFDLNGDGKADASDLSIAASCWGLDLVLSEGPPPTRTATASPSTSATPASTSTPNPSPTPATVATATSTATSTPMPTATATPTTVPAPSQVCTSVSRHGVTWNFSQEYPCGRFANGDWWIVGPAVITAISPDFSGGRNGWQVNPTTTDSQGYDARGANYNAALIPALPYAAPVNSSIVKAVSNAGTVCSYNVWETCYLETAAVLTVLPVAPPQNGAASFRPPYFGAQKPIYSVNNLQPQQLPSRVPNGAVLAQAPSLAETLGAFERLQLDYAGWPNRAIHPQQNLPNYGGDIARQSNVAVLSLMLNDTWAQKLPALIAVIQSGIDHYAMLLNGVAFYSSGGHGLGRKILVMFAGIMLGNTQMQNAVAAADNVYSENTDSYVSEHGEILWGQDNCSEAMYWAKVANPAGNGSSTCRDPYGYIDGGYYSGNGYQATTANAGKGAALAVYLMGAQAVWNNPTQMMFTSRWVDFGTWSQPDPCAPLSQGGGSHPTIPGTCVLDPDLTTGSTFLNFSCQAGHVCGRFADRHGASDGGYGSSFVDAMWDAYVP